MAKRKLKYKSHHKHQSFYREYDFEITVAFLIALGVFLLWEKLEIKATVWKGITGFARLVANFVAYLALGIKDVVQNIETSDIVGMVLIFVAIIMILNRTRIRYIQRKPRLNICPECGGDLHRTHRLFKHHVQEVLLGAKVKRYSCKKCSFKGIEMVMRQK